MASVDLLEDARDEILHPGSAGPPADTLRRYLRLIRELKVRESETTAHAGHLLLSKHESMLSEEERWLVYEQVAVAGLDCGALTLAHSAIIAITQRFQGSFRARRLRGMYYEAMGRFDDARRLYDELLRDDQIGSSKQMILKRQVACEKSAGNTAAAIEQLKKYLESYCNDKEAWEELADLYFRCAMIGQAAFCYEELIMHSPGTIAYIVRYADLLYSLGSQSEVNYTTASTYYTRALQLSKGQCVRALYGVCACCAQLSNSAKHRLESEVPALAAAALEKMYATICPDKLPLLKATLKAQGITPE